MNFNQSRVATLAGVISMFFFSFFGLIFLRYINLIAFVQRRGTLSIMCASHMCFKKKKRVLILNTIDQWRHGGQETHPSTANTLTIYSEKLPETVDNFQAKS